MVWTIIYCTSVYGLDNHLLHISIWSGQSSTAHQYMAWTIIYCTSVYGLDNHLLHISIWSEQSSTSNYLRLPSKCHHAAAVYNRRAATYTAVCPPTQSRLSIMQHPIKTTVRSISGDGCISAPFSCCGCCCCCCCCCCCLLVHSQMQYYCFK